MMVTRFSWILNDCIPLEMLTPTEQAYKKHEERMRKINIKTRKKAFI